MARYLPRDYVPLPDALLWSGADLIDATRRIARNQNWIWANHGNVLAAFGHEPSTAQTPSVTTGTIDAAYFACPNRTATGSDSVRCRGYVTVVTGSANAKIRLYQLLPGEEKPTSITPFDEVALSTAGTDVFFDFNARIRSGDDPLRFCLRLVGAASGTYTLLSATVTWLSNPTSVLGESVAPWAAISQSYVAANRPMSAALLRAISNRTLRLVAENPRPIFAHSFIWPRISTAAAGAETRVALYSARHNGVSISPQVYATLKLLLTGQNAAATFKIKVNGSLLGTVGAGVPILVDGVYVVEATTIFGLLAVPAGDLKIEITAQCTTGATAPPTYCTNVGAAMLGCTLRQDFVHSASDLGLPGTDTVPAAYQPLDENACIPGSRVVAQNDRLGRRAGPYYLVRNLIWLAANRDSHVLVADWTHRSTAGGLGQYNWNAGTSTFPYPSDGVYRNETIFAHYISGADLRDPTPESRDIVPWADRATPTDSRRISAGGQHFIGDVLGRFYCQPMNGGQIVAILRPDMFFAPGGGAAAQEVPEWASPANADLEFYFDSTRDIRTPMGRQGLVGGFRLAGAAGTRPSVGTILSLRANAGIPSGAGNDYWAATVARWGLQGALHAAYVYEAPLEQTELDALA